MYAFLYTLKAKLLKLHKSATMWFNAVMAGAPFGLDYLMQQLPSVRDYMPTNYYGPLLLVAVVGNALLRLKTNTALENK